MENDISGSHYWSYYLFFAFTLVALGFLADKMWGWLWSDKISQIFGKAASRNLDLHFSQLIHDDYKKSQSILDTIFGKNLSRLSFIAVNFVILIIVTLISFGLEHADWISYFGAQKSPVNKYTVIGAVMLLVVTCTAIVSLAITRNIIRLSKPRISILLGIFVADLICAYILFSIPLVTSVVIPNIEGTTIGHIEEVKLVFWSIIIWPKYIYLLHELNMIYYFGAAVLPSIVHITLIFHDIAHIAILRWLYLGLAGLFSELASSQRPLTIIFSGLAVLISILTLYRDSLPS